MQTYNNDRLLRTQDINSNEPSSDSEMMAICAEHYNSISTWILDSASADDAGLRALIILKALSDNQAETCDGLGITDQSTNWKCRQSLLLILRWITKGSCLKTYGRRALAIFFCIRRDHCTARSLTELAERGGCSKQAVSKHYRKFCEHIQEITGTAAFVHPMEEGHE